VNASLLQHGFERQADCQPAAVCLIEDTTHRTYAWVEERANQIARWLHRHGVGPNGLVMIHVTRSERLVPAWLGILKAGAACLPIDPANSAGRLVHVAAARLVITDKGLSGLPASAAPAVAMDDLWEEASREDVSRLPCPATSADLAYAIHTSGSTGEPRLVAIEHHSVVNLITHATTSLLKAADLSLVPFTASLGFDSFVHQLFTTLWHGGSLLHGRDIFSLVASPLGSQITSIGGTPSIIHDLLQRMPLPPAVRVVQLGGEMIPAALIAMLRRSASLRQAYNYYGPTETTIYATVMPLLGPAGTDGDCVNVGAVIGHPVPNVAVSIRDEQGHMVPDGEAGEIWIAGAGVARGYLPADLSDNTAFRRFKDRAGPDVRAYCTGDRGRRLANGALEFLGRIDEQWKVLGKRVEAGEIESRLTALPEIRSAAVVLRAGADSRPRIVAHVVADHDVTLASIRESLRQWLPTAMLPTQLVVHNRLPLAATGKIDRAILRAIIPAGGSESPGGIELLSDLESRVAAAWKRATGASPTGRNDDFWHSGDSLQLAALLLELDREFGVRIDTDRFPKQITFATIAALIAGGPPAAEADQTERASEILRRQRAQIAGWAGDRHRPDALILTNNTAGAEPALFWCLQSQFEFLQLARHFGAGRRLHGMRSGLFIMEYTPDDIASLADCYAKEMEELQPQGAFLLGGNCQGGVIALAVARRLRDRGRKVALLVLMEQDDCAVYDGSVALIFGRDSEFNPYRRHADPDAVFRVAYPAGFTVDIIPGTHGRYFEDGRIELLADTLCRRLPPIGGNGSGQK